MSRNRAVQRLAQAAIRQYPSDAALLLEQMDAKEIARFLGRRSPPAASDVLRRLRADRATDVIEALE